MHNLVRSYLVHYAYVETLQAYEDEEIDVMIPKALNLFPGLSENERKQVHEKKKEEKDAVAAQTSLPTKLERRMTEGEGLKVRFSLDNNGDRDGNADGDEKSPFAPAERSEDRGTSKVDHEDVELSDMSPSPEKSEGRPSRIDK